MLGVLPLVEWPAYKSEPPNHGDWNGVKDLGVVKVVKDRLRWRRRRAAWCPPARYVWRCISNGTWHGSSALRTAGEQTGESAGYRWS
ncbi:hypothetical protein GCM10010344_71310 [Streptomyces bluensis]|nr:hypothetical protein GCM10010344_71310 [Streptomyces bluensis]